MTITRSSVARESARRLRHIERQAGEDIHRLRTEAGLSLGALAEVVGVHKSHLARIESDDAHPSVSVLTAIGVALGADLSIRYFPGAGPRLYDRFQAAMVENLVRSLDPRWHVDLEVPVTQPARGVIDVVLTDRHCGVIVAVEVQSEIRRLEQLLRWSSEKADGLASRLRSADRPVASVDIARLLVLRSTVGTRGIARQFEATLGTAYPARTRDVYLALTTSQAAWPGDGLVWVHQHGTVASLMGLPPRHVALGR